MDGADGEDFVEAEFGKFRRPGFGTLRVNLVDRHQNGLATPAQALGGLAVERRDTFLNVDYQHDHVGRGDGQFHLLQGGFGNRVRGFFTAEQADAAGIHQREGPSLPLRLGADAVARDAGLIVDDGDAPPGDAVEEGGLADIWAAYDGNQTWHGAKVKQSVGALETLNGAVIPMGAS